MRMFEPVVIACDPSTLDLAQGMRAALEAFRLRVYLHFCVQKRNVLDVLAGRVPECRYVVLCCHGMQEGCHGMLEDEPSAGREMRQDIRLPTLP
jgi:hypothetical protein